MCRKSSPRRGFTLIELLAAIAIVGVLASLLYATLANSVRASDRAERISLEYQAYRIVMSRMSADVRSMHYQRSQARDEPAWCAIKGQNGMNEGLPADKLEFATNATAERAFGKKSAPTLRRVKYEILPPGRGGKPGGLAVSSAPVRFENTLTQNYGEPVLLDPNIVGMDIRYLKRDQQTEAWREIWDSAAEKTPPAAVEIALYYRREEKSKVKTTKMTPFLLDVPMAASFINVAFGMQKR